MALDTTPDDDRFFDEDGQPIFRFRLNPTTMEYLVLGSNDWCAWELESSPDIRARLDLEGARATITGVAVLPANWGSGRAITNQDLREVSLVRLEAILNDPRWRYPIQRAARYAQRRSEDLSPLGEVGPAEVAPDREVPPLPPTFALAGVDSPSRPTEFYADVAGAWTAALASGLKNPAEVIASANNVSTTTVHRWVREARRRKVMAPSSRATTTARTGHA